MNLAQTAAATAADGRFGVNLTRTAAATAADGRIDVNLATGAPAESRADAAHRTRYDDGEGRLAQLVRASRLHREGRGFEPLTAHHAGCYD